MAAEDNEGWPVPAGRPVHGTRTYTGEILGVLSALVFVLVLTLLTNLSFMSVAGAAGLVIAGWLLVRSGSSPAVFPAGMFDDAQPVCVDDLVVRRPTPGDSRGVFDTVDDEVLEANGLPRSHARDMQNLTENPTLAHAKGFFVVCCRSAPATVLGCLQFYGYAASDNTADLGLWIGPRSRGRGYASPTIRAAAQLAAQVGLAGLRLGTSPDNERMLKAFERSGAKFTEETLHRLPNGDVVASSWWTLSCSR